MKAKEFIDQCKVSGKQTTRLVFRDNNASNQFASAEFISDGYRRIGNSFEFRLTVDPKRYGNSAEKVAFVVKKYAQPSDDILIDGKKVISVDYNRILNKILVNYGGIDESILDTPKSGMDESVWDTSGDEPVLTDTADTVIQQVINWAQSELGLDFEDARITGSIASNSYSDASDVDLHFLCPGADPDETNKALRDAFDEYKKTFDISIGGHPIEVYAQTNLYQDLMSVGCYSVTKREWLVGPDVKDTAFDPMSEYYAADMKHVDSIISDIRNIILECYEMALVIKRSTDTEFKQKISAKLGKPLAKAKKLFDGAREKRRVISAPASAEEALKMRNSRAWHIADSAFKLMDKFGYMPILKAYSNAEGNPDQKADAIISVVKDNLANNKMLTDSERELFETDIESGIQGLEISKHDIEKTCWEFAENRLTGEDIEITGLFIHGSRTRHTARPDSDLDVVVSYIGDEREDAVFDILNAEPKLKIDDVIVDFNPIRPEETGDLDDYIKRSDEYDQDILNGRRVDEGVKEQLSMAAIAAMLAIPGILPAKTVETQLKRLPRTELKMNSDRVQEIVKSGDMIKGLAESNVINAVARTIYAEAKGEGLDGQSAVASVIWNRAGGDKTKLVDVIKQPKHFSCWNKYTGGWTDKDGYKSKIPDGAWLNGTVWNNCVKLATEMVNGEFESTIGNRNCYMNKEISDKKNVESWGKLCDYKVGKQHFGYQKCYDGFKNIKTADGNKTYTVVKGDTLDKIAKANGTTADSIAKLNGLKDKNKIRIGQKLKV